MPISKRNVDFIGIYEPQNGCDIHEAVAHMARVAALLEKRNNIDVAIIKSLEQSWAAVFAVWKGGSSGDGPALNLPEAAAFTKGMVCAVRIVDSGWFRLSSQEISKGVSFAQLSLVTLLASAEYTRQAGKYRMFSHTAAWRYSSPTSLGLRAYYLTLSLSPLTGSR